MKSLLLLALIALAGCATRMPISHNADTGAYTQTTGWYRTVNGSLQAFDGQDWYELVSPSFQVGPGISAPERWVKLDGSRHKYYVRTLAAYRNQSAQPVFMPR